MTYPAQIQPGWLEISPSLPCKLSQWGLIVVEGSDAASFLQNQLTNSVLGLNRTLPGLMAQGRSGSRLVGYCNPKGRLLASAWLGLFAFTADAEDRFALFISKDIAASTAKRLSMYVLRSKVKVTDLSASWSVAGIYGVDEAINAVKLDQQCLALRLPDVLVGSRSTSRLLLAYPNQTPIDVEDSGESLFCWSELEILSAIPRIVEATQEQFVPQMINFESVAGIDFKKGCYPGQEIVARSQYRGVIKRRLQIAHTTIDEQDDKYALPGIELFHSKDPRQPTGMVVLSTKHPTEPGRIDLQIECKLDALDSGEIHLGSATGPVLKIDSLPYPLLEI